MVTHSRWLLSFVVAVFVAVGGLASAALHTPSAAAQIPQGVANVICENTVPGQGDCTVTLSMDLIPGATLTAMLPSPAATFLDCSVASGLGSCTTAPNGITFACTTDCPAGSPFEEILGGDAASAYGQAVTLTYGQFSQPLLVTPASDLSPLASFTAPQAAINTVAAQQAAVNQATEQAAIDQAAANQAAAEAQALANQAAIAAQSISQPAVATVDVVPDNDHHGQASDTSNNSGNSDNSQSHGDNGHGSGHHGH